MRTSFILAAILGTLTPRVFASPLQTSALETGLNLLKRQPDCDGPTLDPVTYSQPVNYGTKETSGPFANRIVAEYNWEVTWQQVAYHDSDLPVHRICKDMMVINGQWPPPTVAVEKGTVLRITIKNYLGQQGSDPHNWGKLKSVQNPEVPISLHAHGLYQQDTPWLDGPVGVTQVGIDPGKQFQYTWDTQNEAAGTYWIHSHVKGQYPMGLRMPLIIRDASEDSNWPKSKLGTTEWDPSLDHVMTLSEWYRKEWYGGEGTILTDYEKNKCGLGIEQPPDRAVINDGGFTEYDLRGPKSGRLRIINTSAYSFFNVYIRGDDNYDIKMQVIEADGVPMDGRQIYRVLELAPGQRLSVLVDPDDVVRGTPRRYPLVAAIMPHDYRRNQLNKMQDCPFNVDDRLPQFAGSNANKEFITMTWATVVMGSKDLHYKPNVVIPKYPKLITHDATYRMYFPWLTDIASASTDWDAQIPVDTVEGTGNSPFMNVTFSDFDDLQLIPLAPKTAIFPAGPENRWMVETWESSPERWGNLRVIDPDNWRALTDLAVENNNASYIAWNDPLSTGKGPSLQQAIEKGSWTSPADWAPNPGNTLLFRSAPANNPPDNPWTFWVAIYDRTGTHPFHLHGHHFQVLYRQREQVTPSNEARIDTLKAFWGDPSAYIHRGPSDPPGKFSDADNPLRRDTITIYKNALTILRVTADNPGAWFFHCHNDFHVESGMAAQVIEGDHSGVSAKVPQDETSWQYISLQQALGKDAMDEVVPNQVPEP